MKKSGFWAASAAVASASAVSASSNSKIQICREDGSSKHGGNNSSQTAASSDQFAPRFDGLRFIETLVTAHR
ncbi:hypothetical protein RJ639_016016 [Escallonia herrerae]|uniref:Uncharacterized protein n=1 Tax=Escallonia herrerae TaxID=1293975 RepID=A0AA89AMF0_9ASTE|nr:hypothetical protein RJ639_016016 [Escallonia herrerae]